MKKFAVFGNPISQSLSPSIHQMFATQQQQQITYEKICAPIDAFAASVREFLAQPDAVGCNVTVPFKTQAFELVDRAEPAAKLAGAVNTILRSDDGTLDGFNTDGIGLVNDLLRCEVMLQGAKVVLLGAGGAARGVVHPLLNAGVSSIAISNRTAATAKALIEEINDTRVTVYEDNADNNCDVIINSTSASLSGMVPEFPASLVSATTVAYDMVYAAEPTSFMRHVLQLGSGTQMDGLGMLVGQAAAAYEIWTGFRPDVNPVLRSLRASISQH